MEELKEIDPENTPSLLSIIKYNIGEFKTWAQS